jgi:C4-type Zn-finger protein
MSEFDTCPHCGREWLETLYSQEQYEGVPLEALEECQYCGFQREIDMITGEATVLYEPQS